MQQCDYKRSILVVSKSKISKRKWTSTSFRNQLLVIKLVETLTGLEYMGDTSRIMLVAKALQRI
jgi:hypothetical protein